MKAVSIEHEGSGEITQEESEIMERYVLSSLPKYDETELARRKGIENKDIIAQYRWYDDRRLDIMEEIERLQRYQEMTQ